MLSNVNTNHSIKFLGSELYRKMCPFVSVSCLHQKLCHFVSYLDFSGLVQRVEMKAFWTLFQLGTQYNIKIDT